jgi:site-specific DNA-methyltransferase (adenine-specific)
MKLDIWKKNNMIKLIQGDCLEIMNELIKENYIFDAIITDPPYGTIACKWDSIIPLELMWEKLNKLIKPNGAIVLFGSEPFSSALRMSNIKNFRYDIIWNKIKPSNFQMMNFQVCRVHEIISIFSQKPAVFCRGNHMCYYPQKSNYETPRTVKKSYYGSKNSTLREGHTIKNMGEKTYTEKHPTSIFTLSNANIKSKVHPTEKPVLLMEYLIKTYTKEGEMILDFTMGSGSTGVACVNTNRSFIGIEILKEYYDIAKERIENIKKEEI